MQSRLPSGQHTHPVSAFPVSQLCSELCSQWLRMALSPIWPWAYYCTFLYLFFFCFQAEFSPLSSYISSLSLPVLLIGGPPLHPHIWKRCSVWVVILGLKQLSSNSYATSKWGSCGFQAHRSSSYKTILEAVFCVLVFFSFRGVLDATQLRFVCAASEARPLHHCTFSDFVHFWTNWADDVVESLTVSGMHEAKFITCC